MDTDLRQLAEQYERHRTAALDTQRRIASLTASATSPKGLLTATVGARGELKDLAFHSRAYRDMPPAELAHTIIETVEQARRAVLNDIAAALPAQLFGGTAMTEALAGNLDLNALLPPTASLGTIRTNQ